MTVVERPQRMAQERTLVEILYFDGCPNHEPALALIERLSRDLGVAVDIELIAVPDDETASALRFLGSPTVRVDGCDVDPQAQERSDHGLSCRIFQTEAGVAGQPDERWVRDALLRAAAAEAPEVGLDDDVVERALRAAGIAPERRGRDRAGRLTGDERVLYQWILRRFADAVPPSAADVAAQAERFGLDPAAALATLAREDLVHSDDGAITVAYPFSARPRGHQVLIDGRRRVEAMCAIDALGIAPMLDDPVGISSHDPVSGGRVWVRLDSADGGGAWWEPSDAVVLAASASCGGPSFRGCCDVLNFFTSTATAARYLRHHSDVSGFAIPIPEAIAVGRAVFGGLLD